MNYSVTISDRETGDIVAQCDLDEIPVILAILEWKAKHPLEKWMTDVLAERKPG